MDGGGGGPRSRVYRVTVEREGEQDCTWYWHVWVTVRLDTGLVEIYDDPEEGEPMAVYTTREVQIDWRAPGGGLPF